jgi:hypothetical protein
MNELLKLVPLRGTTTQRVEDLDPVFVRWMIDLLTEMPADLRKELTIGSARRYTEEQRKKYDLYKRGGPLAAKPGTSRHEFGEAIDFWPISGKSWHKKNFKFREAVFWIYRNGPRFGIRGLSSVGPDGKLRQQPRDIVHFQKMTDEEIREHNKSVPEPVPELPPQPKTRPKHTWLQWFFNLWR